MKIRIVQIVVLALALISAAQSQYNSFNQRDDKYRLLGLRRAKEYFEVTRKEFERQQALFDKGLISQVELDRSKNAYADAEVNYQQSLLAVLFEQQFITVDRAVKYQAEDGTKRVRLGLANASGGGEFQKLVGIDDKLFRSLQPDVITNIYVSLYNQEGAIISQPYESKIDELRYGKPRTVEFTLLQDLDAVTVNLLYGNGSSRTLRIFLQKDVTADKVLVQSQQFSQEGELGRTATYDLTLELFSGSQNTFSLDVANLPQQIDRYFRDVGSNARLTQIRFTESAHSRKASLEISLPDRPTDEVTMDKPISFYVLVVPTDRVKEMPNLAAKTWTEEEISALKVGFVKLELVPRGKGRLLVRAPQLYHVVQPGQPVTMVADIVNEGTRRLDNVKVDVDLPFNWTKSVEPAVIPTLEINGERRVTVTVTPPAEISVGRYEFRLRTSGLSDNQPVNAEDKTVTAEVAAEAGGWGTILLVLAILGVVGGLVVFSIRLSRR
jgi:hypothetical protein